MFRDKVEGRLCLSLRRVHIYGESTVRAYTVEIWEYITRFLLFFPRENSMSPRHATRVLLMRIFTYAILKLKHKYSYYFLLTRPKFFLSPL